ncbi:glyoxalase superfamily protein [Micromonospora sp. MH99]|uniref:glyoxalase superfamily protein n=1 Tax=Micromonospora sp. MH99 TaxID=1945510 RepID=UPI0035A8F19C
MKQWEHRFASDLPLYVSIALGDVDIHLSEHTGDTHIGEPVASGTPIRPGRMQQRRRDISR